jgi:hypothetical protein
MWATGRIWEDALTTTTHARSFADGFGLTHHVGEPPTYGFTSALSVLMAIPGELVAVGGGVNATRIASLVSVVIALVFARRLADMLGLSKVATVLVLAFLALDQLQVFYGMVGMETQVAVAVLLVSAYYVTREDTWKAGLSLGVAVLARPDFLIWVAVALIWLFLRSKSAAVRAAAAGGAVLLPWIVFTIIYYGSPIPQTIQAKAVVYAAYPRGVLDIPAWFLEGIATHGNALVRTFAPFLEDTLAAGAPVPLLMLVLVSAVTWSLVAIGGIRARRQSNAHPILGFVTLYLIYRVAFGPTIYSDWYVPPFSAMAILLAGLGLDRVARGRGRILIAVALAGAFALPLPWVYGMEHETQVAIDREIVPVGVYLRDHMSPGEALYAEPAGYLGFYSRATLWDYPGLTSRKSLATIRAIDDKTIAGLAAALRASWMFLRTNEYADLSKRYPEVIRSYSTCRTGGFDMIGDSWAGYVRPLPPGFLPGFVILHVGGCPPE